MTTEEKIKVMQAYVDGKYIGLSRKGERKYNSYSIRGFSEIIWNWEEYDYVVEKEPKYIPFDFSDACSLIKTPIKQKDKQLVTEIYYIDSEYINYHISYQSLLNDFTFLDGTPCGKLA